jgi:hypothetical protein
MKAANGPVADTDSPLLETFTNIAHLQVFQGRRTWSENGSEKCLFYCV